MCGGDGVWWCVVVCGVASLAPAPRARGAPPTRRTPRCCPRPRPRPTHWRRCCRGGWFVWAARRPWSSLGSSPASRRRARGWRPGCTWPARSPWATDTTTETVTERGRRRYENVPPLPPPVSRSLSLAHLDVRLRGVLGVHVGLHHGPRAPVLAQQAQVHRHVTHHAPATRDKRGGDEGGRAKGTRRASGHARGTHRLSPLPWCRVWCTK
jgi:hypothetical protein